MKKLMLVGSVVFSAAVAFATALPEPIDGKITLSVASGTTTYDGRIPTGVAVEKTGGGEAVLCEATDAIGAETCLSSTESLDLTGSTIEIVDPENLPAYVRSRGRLISCDKGLVGVPNFSQKGWHLTCKGDSVSLAADRGMVLVLH